MKKEALSVLLVLFGFSFTFAQEKPKSVSNELVQIKVDPRRSHKSQPVRSADNVRSEGIGDRKQKPRSKNVNNEPRKAELRVVPVKKKTTNREDNK